MAARLSRVPLHFPYVSKFSVITFLGRVRLRVRPAQAAARPAAAAELEEEMRRTCFAGGEKIVGGIS